MLKLVLYLRGLFIALFFGLHTLMCSFIVIPMLIFRFPRAIVDLVIGPLWCGLMVWVSGVRPVVEGVENVPKESGFLYLFTHSSHMDIPILFVSSPKSFRFGAKASLFKIPFFGKAMALAGTLPIERGDRKKVFEVYRQAEERVARGEAFALAPEGGRRVGDEIKDFKSGPFMFAINARMPIVPVVMCGVDRVVPKGSIVVNPNHWTTKVGVRFLPAVETKDIPIEDMKKLKEAVRQDVVRNFEEMKKAYL